MRELKARLRALDEAQAPDLWPDAKQRIPTTHLAPSAPRGATASRILAGVVALVVFVAATVFVWQAFRPDTVGPSATSTYTDPSLGWSVTAPPSLLLHAIGATTDRGQISGVSVANFNIDAVPEQHGLQPLQNFPPTGVLFMMWDSGGFGLAPVNATNDSRLPLSLSDYHRIQPYVGGDEPTPVFDSVVGGAGWFASAVWIGPQASDTDRRAIEQTVASVSFPHLRPFSLSPTSSAIVLPAASAFPVGSVTAITPQMLKPVGSSATNLKHGFYVVHGTHGYYAVPMEAQAPQTQKTCHVSANQSDITFSCANGATWDRYVSAVTPPANNDEMHGYWLFAMPVTVAWDGHLLVNNGNDPRVAPDAWTTSRSG